MFLLESAALPGENDACGRVPIPPSSFSVPARVAVCIRVAKIASPSPPPLFFFVVMGRKGCRNFPEQPWRGDRTAD